MHLAAAFSLVWLGMIVAISFIEAPLKFRAPGVTVPIGLGIGRLVFRALNVAEAALALGVLAALVTSRPSGDLVAAAATAPALLLVQLLAVRPVLARRTARVLAGDTGSRSRAHLGYIVLEVLKTIALITAGALLLSA